MTARKSMAAHVRLLASASLLGAVTAPAHAQDNPPPAQGPGAVPAVPAQAEELPEDRATAGDIVVTARQRPETLVRTPVAVTALDGEAVQRYQSKTLAAIGEMAPGVVIGNTQSNGGGAIAVRGISTSAATVGFEQPVSIVIDGIPYSSGWVVSPGYFDVKQVEILKGPQALLFGKNNSAGVIAIQSAGPTDQLSGYINASYEFVADEATVEAAVGGPVGGGFGLRLAVRARNQKGWVHNIAGPIANPFLPAFPLPGAGDDRLGEREQLGRLTATYEAGSDFSATLKVLGVHRRDDGPGIGNQIVGGCDASGRPRAYNNVDTYGECVPDNRTSSGWVNPALLKGFDYAGTGGREYGKFDSIMSSLNAQATLGRAKVSSITGYTWWSSNHYGNLDETSFAQLVGTQPMTVRSFTQELRVLTDFDSPLNFMVGGFYQDFDIDPYVNVVKIRDDLNYDTVTGKAVGFDKRGYQHGKTYSAFGQTIFAPSDKFEIAGGLRWTRELKDLDVYNAYSHQAGFPQGKRVAGAYRDSNLSPEVTVSYHPSQQSTLYVAYKTGYKSGGFSLTSTIGAASTASDFDFGAERVSGFEAGAKGEMLNGKLLLQATGYAYDYKDLQVNAYTPSTLSYTLANAGGLRQRGFEVSADYRPARGLQLRSAISYNRNRFNDFAGQCYSGQTAALGCNITPGPQQNFTGRAPARSPDFSGNGGATYTMPIGDFDLAMSGDAYYTDGYFASETLAPASYQPSFWRFNASARLASRDGWSFGVVGRNLGNKYYIVIAQDKTGQAGEQRGTVARGREFSLEARYNF